MQYLLDKLPGLSRALFHKRLGLFLDYDGTLAPIADRPENAVLPARTRKILRELSNISDIKIAIVTGRSLSYIQHAVNVKGLVYAGNHGLEIAGPGIEYRIKIPATTIELTQTIKRMLTYKLGSINGVHIEDKGIAVALHYRKVKPALLPMVNDYFNYVAQPYIMTRKVDLLSGKMVHEIRPHIDWNKGNAVMWLLSKFNNGANKEILPVYIGDDVTDESVFKCLEDAGITVFVGEHRKTAAKHFVKNTDEVYDVLTEIKRIVTHE